MAPPRILPSTTSHKREPFLATLEVFSRLGLRDLDLNLGHLIEGGVPVEEVARGLAAGSQTAWVVSGGWCDFYHRAPRIEDTIASVDRQVDIARRLGVGALRLFFGRLKRDDYSGESRDVICGNLRRLSDRYPDIALLFENHDGASLCPDICREILAGVDRPNVRMNFDPINFERAGVRSADALRILEPLIGHVHLKGLDGDELCEFGVGGVDLTPVLRTLLAHGYGGSFTVEYEGTFDRTLRLYQSVHRAETVLKDLSKTVETLKPATTVDTEDTGGQP
jgi:sugar phosphate isomerase/epimerase